MKQYMKRLTYLMIAMTCICCSACRDQNNIIPNDNIKNDQQSSAPIINELPSELATTVEENKANLNQPADQFVPAPLPPQIRIVETTVQNNLPSFIDGDKLIGPAQPTLLGRATVNEEIEIRKVFFAFRDSLLAYDPNTVNYLAKPSLEYYDYLIQVAKLAAFNHDEYEKTKRNIPIGVRTNAEIILARLSPEFIKTTTPEQLYRLAFKEGWIGHKTFQSASIDNIQAFDNKGSRYITGDFYYEGTVKDEFVARIAFVLENDVWKVDLMPIFIAIEQAIENHVQQGKLNPEAVAADAVEATQKNLAQDNWPLYTSAVYKFSVRFPKSPLIQKDNAIDVLTASDHRYGQFGVMIEYFDKDDPKNPYAQPEIERKYISQFVFGLGAQKPDCRPTTHKQDKAVYCLFKVPEQNATMLVATFISETRTFRVFNQAPDSMFNLDVAQKFVSTFDY